MPRLGDDANVATAYPNRMPNLRGGWLRQFATTAFGTLLLLLIMKNVIKNDYKVNRRSKKKQPISLWRYVVVLRFYFPMLQYYS